MVTTEKKLFSIKVKEGKGKKSYVYIRAKYMSEALAYATNELTLPIYSIKRLKRIHRLDDKIKEI